MEIIVKKNILDELQSKTSLTRSESTMFLVSFVREIALVLADGKEMELKNFILLSPLLSHAKKNRVTTNDLACQIAGKNKWDTSSVIQALEVFLSFVKEKILKGTEVQITQFASFHLKLEESRVVETEKGNRILRPTHHILSWDIEDSFLELCKNEKVQLQVQSEFEQRLKLLQRDFILLVFPEFDVFVDIVQYHFEQYGWKVNITNSIPEAELYLDEIRPHIVIIDTRVKNYQEIIERIKCDIHMNFTPILLLYSKEEQRNKEKNFCIVPDDFLVEPFEIKRFLKITNELLRREIEGDKSFIQEVLMEFPTVEEHIEHAHKICTTLLADSGLDEETQITLNAAFREALANAAQHGNKHRRDKLLKILYLLHETKITISITDSGKGFDWQEYLLHAQQSNVMNQAKESYNDGRFGGLGMMLICKCVDKLEYNDRGNVITLTKYLQKADAKHAE
ncbi:MAG: ATP-binding protein [Planctomycetes bacterium]|jgi:serine/threonine-protein kinase RsbW|nr:ATP-binding protein [Planctomycetota bacterium]HPY74241.1 ATP-binding protein [Planctomycetota bacterium]HQB00069.1 ATP-binding protein [Planctomycetota bacterium]